MDVSLCGLKLGLPVAWCEVCDWPRERIGLSTEVQMPLLVTIVVIAGLWILERLVLAVVYRRVTDPWTRYRWRKTITYLTLTIGVLVIGREWLAGVQFPVPVFWLAVGRLRHAPAETAAKLSR